MKILDVLNEKQFDAEKNADKIYSACIHKDAKDPDNKSHAARLLVACGKKLDKAGAGPDVTQLKKELKELQKKGVDRKTANAFAEKCKNL